MSVGDGLDGPKLYSPHEVAQRWGVTAETVRACIRSGALEAFRVGPRLLRISADKLAEYEARKVAEPMTPERREAERARDRHRTVVLRALKAGATRGRVARGGT